MTTRQRTSGKFELPIPASEAIGFFTPEGERSWVPGWEPAYPAGNVSESPATVFVTRHAEVETTWVIERIDREDCAASYARITPGHHAGTVRVHCEDQTSGGCLVAVEYDMTSLSAADLHVLDAYAEEHLASMMKEWATMVVEGLANR